MKINSYNIKQLTSICFLLFLCFNKAISQTKETVLNLIWTGLGGKEAWDEAHFFMFTCNPSTKNLTKGSHTYIWDSKSGRCRFEGILPEKNEKLVVLFNSKNKSGQVYVNNKRLTEKKEAREWLSYALNSFQNDAYWLFPPLLLEGSQHIEVSDQELIGNKKYFTLEIQTTVTSKLYIDVNNGQIFQWESYNSSGVLENRFLCMRYKDIGGGIQLATFLNDPERNQSISYPIVSALVNVEPQKFSSP
ncbi:hypothetical protein [Olivibacter sitiensis]|uniref:hypothetical protein n=1 Tax=Olivibacter sitiensis TaxID=376470 RepID=UPI000484BC7E|nr:hypothetical protein [Olivibacter sitiensis]